MADGKLLESSRNSSNNLALLSFGVNSKVQEPPINVARNLLLDTQSSRKPSFSKNNSINKTTIERELTQNVRIAAGGSGNGRRHSGNRKESMDGVWSKKETGKRSLNTSQNKQKAKNTQIPVSAIPLSLLNEKTDNYTTL